MDKSAASALADLRGHWGDVYRIGYDLRDGTWWAQYVGANDVLNADAAEELRHKIRDDCSERKMRERDAQRQ